MTVWSDLALTLFSSSAMFDSKPCRDGLSGQCRVMRITVPIAVTIENTGPRNARRSRRDSEVEPGTIIVSPGDRSGVWFPFFWKSFRFT